MSRLLIVFYVAVGSIVVSRVFVWLFDVVDYRRQSREMHESAQLKCAVCGKNAVVGRWDDTDDLPVCWCAEHAPKERP